MGDKTRARSSPRRAAAGLLVMVAVLSGCGALRPWDDRQIVDEDYVGSEMSILSTHLDTMRSLADSERAEQVRLFDETRYAAEATGTSSRRLRLALAMAVPGHPSSNAAEAYEMLTALLDAPDALLRSERRLARVQLTELRQRMILEAEVASLNEKIRTTPRPPRRAAPSPELTERVAELQMQNEQLATDLAEALAKLEAVMAIESDADR